MGLGLSVSVPIIFSAAGRRHDMPAGTVAAILSMLAASGQLFIPPLIGMLGSLVGLQEAMGVVGSGCAPSCFWGRARCATPIPAPSVKATARRTGTLKKKADSSESAFFRVLSPEGSGFLPE